jgi:hypothetical protein
MRIGVFLERLPCDTAAVRDVVKADRKSRRGLIIRQPPELPNQSNDPLHPTGIRGAPVLHTVTPLSFT